MSLEMRLVCKSLATVSTNEWSLAQVNLVHMTLQMYVLSEELPTGDALERLLPKVNCLEVPMHDTALAEDFGAQRVTAWNRVAQMSHTIVLQHVRLPRE